MEAARGLIGALLVREGDGSRRTGMIVEVEAYAGPEDRASHARFGPRSRAVTMFGPPGRAYVYGVYGMHTCLNVVVGPAGSAAAVLLLAGLARSRGADRALLRSLSPANGRSRVARVRAIYRRSGALDAARTAIARHTRNAEQALERLPRNRGRAMLAWLADELMERRS